MYTHILVPTDGTVRSKHAVDAAIRLAAPLGARVTVFHVIPRFHASDVIMGLLEANREDYERAALEFARSELASARRAAEAAGVACDSLHATGDDVAREIVAAATRAGCDLILMASHGRHGIEAVLLGSETQKVLAHSRIPVLVHR